jgi:hypothetical protein
MEQFSRECLEFDNETAPHPSEPPDLMSGGSSMDTVYDRAAKLVQRTLDVEGVIVMDVSHFEVLESMSAESTVSVVLYHGDPDVETSTQALSVEEYGKLNDIFTKYPEGKISEGVVPSIFRLFLPQGPIQYALSKIERLLSGTRLIFFLKRSPFTTSTSGHLRCCVRGMLSTKHGVL